ncbi:hypothetical protein [Photobacterium indicum]|uniref:hypothetical protein n=1 Tax=Photobacterium indicum TaxID=81447 RepID=UPI0014754AB4|nr:hypothetical protein [Photobacterium indicum]
MQGSCPEGALIGKHLAPSASIIEIVKGDVFLSCSTRFGVIPDTLVYRRKSNPFILVLGHSGNELAERYENNAKISIVVNPDYRRGMFGSIQVTSAAYHAVCESAHRKYQIDY